MKSNPKKQEAVSSKKNYMNSTVRNDNKRKLKDFMRSFDTKIDSKTQKTSFLAKSPSPKSMLSTANYMKNTRMEYRKKL